MRVFVTGGTGLVGRRLVRALVERGDQPVVLTRRSSVAQGSLGSKVELIQGDPMQKGAWMDKIDDFDAVVHLAGENVFGKRWNAQVKQMLVDSRVLSTRNVATALTRKPRRADGQPKALVNASAIGYYGPHGDEELTEESPPGDDFLAHLCVQWEQAAHAVEPAGVRCTILRVGVVLDSEGGALAKMLTPFKMGVGGPIAGGRQFISWIHHADLIGLLLLALDNGQCSGPLNGTAPNPVSNRDFSRALGKALGRPAFMPTPGFGLRVMLGEAAHIINTGQRVLPKKALALGYVYQFPTIDAALADVLR
jgi:uncharacterized protein (TIGR01777 family)